jgi:hypothetical protein
MEFINQHKIAVASHGYILHSLEAVASGGMTLMPTPTPIDSSILDPAACEQMSKKSSTNARCRKYK